MRLLPAVVSIPLSAARLVLPFVPSGIETPWLLWARVVWGFAGAVAGLSAVGWGNVWTGFATGDSVLREDIIAITCLGSRKGWGLLAGRDSGSGIRVTADDAVPSFNCEGLGAS